MKKRRLFFDLVPAMILWLMLSIFLWSFVFNFLTDAPREEKLVIFIDAPVKEETHLAAALEEKMPEGIRMVQVRPFSYAMMGSDDIENADLYIISQSAAEEYAGWFPPLPDEMQQGEVLMMEGIPAGVKIYDAASQSGPAMEYIQYAVPGKEEEDYYLFAGKNSLHLDENDKAVDNAAVLCAFELIR